MKRRIVITTYCNLLILLITFTAAQVRADAYVSISVDGFWPQTVSIAPGETVIWTVEDDLGPYTISSPSGAWLPIYLYDSGDMEGLQFNQAGNYGYYDAFSGNSGSIHVGASVPNVPPSINITSPNDGAVFLEPATFVFSCDASDTDDGIMDVEFYDGATLVDLIFAPPYTTTITNLAAGAYTLMAVVYDYTGAATTNQVNITVQSRVTSAITLSAPRLVSGQFQFDVAGTTIGRTIVIKSSSDLSSTAAWTALQTNVVRENSFQFSTAASGGRHFFRAIQLP